MEENQLKLRYHLSHNYEIIDNWPEQLLMSISESALLVSCSILIIRRNNINIAFLFSLCLRNGAGKLWDFRRVWKSIKLVISKEIDKYIVARDYLINDDEFSLFDSWSDDKDYEVVFPTRDGDPYFSMIIIGTETDPSDVFPSLLTHHPRRIKHVINVQSSISTTHAKTADNNNLISVNQSLRDLHRIKRQHQWYYICERINEERANPNNHWSYNWRKRTVEELQERISKHRRY